LIPLNVEAVMVEFTTSPLTLRRRPVPVEKPSIVVFRVLAVNTDVVATDPVSVE
jgi:hypothetical protein